MCVVGVDEAKRNAILAFLAKGRKSGSDLARALSSPERTYSPQLVLNWLRGSHSPRDDADWEKMLEIAQEWAHSPIRNTLESDVRVFRRGTRFIPVFSGLPAGNPAQGVGDVDWIEVMDWGTSFDRWARVIDGFSMESELHPGDIAVFENRRAEHSHVVHARKHGEDSCKVIWQQSLKPINPDYEDLDLAGWEILGVLVELHRKTAYGTSILKFDHGMRHRFSQI